MNLFMFVSAVKNGPQKRLYSISVECVNDDKNHFTFIKGLRSRKYASRSDLALSCGSQ